MNSPDSFSYNLILYSYLKYESTIMSFI